MSTAPFPKWVYDIVMELQHCKNNGLVAGLDTLLAVVPNGMRLAAQGILDYHQLMNETAPPATPAAPDAQPIASVMPLQQAAANGQLSQGAQ